MLHLLSFIEANLNDFSIEEFDSKELIKIHFMWLLCILWKIKASCKTVCMGVILVTNENINVAFENR